MVGQALKWMLTGYGTDGYNPQYDIYNFIGSNIYPNIIPQNVSYPALTYKIDRTYPDRVKGSRPLDNRVSVEIDIRDSNYSVVSQLSTLVINQLHRYKNTYNSNDSDGIGYGTTEGSNKYGRFAPASTGVIQYVGGLQIQYLSFDNLLETYDDKLDIYTNTLVFDMMFIEDPTIWGADMMLKLEDLNLMSTNVGGSDDPLYTQPIALNQGVNYLFTPCVFSDTDNVESSTLDGIYENFNDPSGTSNTNRPTLKVSANNPPKYNQQNYLEFSSSEYLLSSNASDRLARKYKELTFFSVVELPSSYNTAKGSSIVFKRDSTSDSSGGVYVFTDLTGDPSTTGTCTFYGGAIFLDDDGAGGETHKGVEMISGIISWPFIGLNEDLSMENPFYFSFNVKRDDGDSNKVTGTYEWITSSDLALEGSTTTSLGGDRNHYASYTGTSSSGFPEYFFNFESLHSDISSYDTNGAGTINLNDAVNIYDCTLIPEYITMGDNRYNQIKQYILTKHNLYQRVTN